jgi:hypothetical protein
MIEQVDAGWSVREFHGVDLADARLNRRLLALAETFGAQPAAPINQASDDWYATKAAYAFFANPKATPAELLAPHQERTLERMQAHNLVLLAQDTTFLNYTHHPATAGLGPIGGGQRGLVMHSTLAFTPHGLPLGVLAQHIWARPEAAAATPKRTRRPIAEKESRKWLDALQETVTLVPDEIRLVTIAFSRSRHLRVSRSRRPIGRRLCHSGGAGPACRWRVGALVGTYGRPTDCRKRERAPGGARGTRRTDG